MANSTTQVFIPAPQWRARAGRVSEDPLRALRWAWRARFVLAPLLVLCLVVLLSLGLIVPYHPLYHLPTHQAAKALATLPPPPPLVSSHAQAEPPPKVKLAPLHQRQQRWWPLVRQLSREHGVDPALAMAVVQVESHFNPRAVSQKGAVGLMQIVPETAEHLGLDDPLDPEANLEAGIRYLSRLNKLFEGDLVLTLAAYNAGPTKVLNEGAVPNYRETKTFIVRVLSQVDRFRTRFQRLAVVR